MDASIGVTYRRIAALSVLGALVACSTSPQSTVPTGGSDAERRLATFANPVDLPYRYQAAKQPYREAADPTIISFQGRYWMFPSHSKGYWHSKDLLHWSFVEARGYDVDKYAPTVLAMNSKLYLAASENAKTIWVSEDPMTGVWTEAAQIEPKYNDPCLFLDDDDRLYLYEGLSGKDVLRVIELDPKTFQPLQQAAIPQSRDKQTRGWEVVGDQNEKHKSPSYIEGSWVTKYQGKYYLQYAAPGTEFKTYADGVLVSDHPMGPFVYQSYSPISAKPTGFITGAGHGSVFQAIDGAWWRASTMTISRRHRFERRVGLFPSYFTRRGELVADTYLGDYPRYIDGDRGLTGWMLLSRHKAVTSSSSLARFPPQNAVDEDIRTWWSAQTGGADEWFQIDLGALKQVEAVQINFADQDSTGRGISLDAYRYALEVSVDGQRWKTVVDASKTGRDAPHDYAVLSNPERTRFVRIRNFHSPDGSKFSLYDLRVFGNGDAPVPSSVHSGKGVRDAADGRRATISWEPVSDAEFYIVRLGVRPDLLTQNYQVYDGQTELTVATLNSEVKYYFAVDAVNERGIAQGALLGAIN